MPWTATGAVLVVEQDRRADRGGVGAQEDAGRVDQPRAEPEPLRRVVVARRSSPPGRATRRAGRTSRRPGVRRRRAAGRGRRCRPRPPRGRPARTRRPRSGGRRSAPGGRACPRGGTSAPGASRRCGGSARDEPRRTSTDSRSAHAERPTAARLGVRRSGPSASVAGEAEQAQPGLARQVDGERGRRADRDQRADAGGHAPSGPARTRPGRSPRGTPRPATRRPAPAPR